MSCHMATVTVAYWHSGRISTDIVNSLSIFVCLCFSVCLCVCTAAASSCPLGVWDVMTDQEAVEMVLQHCRTCEQQQQEEEGGQQQQQEEEEREKGGRRVTPHHGVAELLVRNRSRCYDAHMILILLI